MQAGTTETGRSEGRGPGHSRGGTLRPGPGLGWYIPKQKGDKEPAPGPNPMCDLSNSTTATARLHLAEPTGAALSADLSTALHTVSLWGCCRGPRLLGPRSYPHLNFCPSPSTWGPAQGPPAEASLLGGGKSWKYTSPLDLDSGLC